MLFAGDLVFNGGTPFVLMGSVERRLEVLDGLCARSAPRRSCPGTAPSAGPGSIDDVADYLRFVHDLAERGRAAGLSPLEAARETDLGPVRRAGSTPSGSSATCTAPTPSSTAPRGARRSTSSAALDDMVAYNGGRPADLPGLNTTGVE